MMSYGFLSGEKRRVVSAMASERMDDLRGDIDALFLIGDAIKDSPENEGIKVLVGAFRYLDTLGAAIMARGSRLHHDWTLAALLSKDHAA